MGSSSEQRISGGVVSTAPGTLVWVRRRNGSWWPGLVISPEGQPPGRRKGMPVKLLGKENGSMDWYDVQRSKRIKAFRCGEYDECIQKAMESLFCSNMPDRMGKYARRNDAIIHALEIEKSFRSSRYQELCSGAPQVDRRKGHKKQYNQFMEPDPACSKVMGSNLSPVICTKPITLKKRRWKRLNAPDDDENRVTSRMRGLRDIDVGMKSKPKADTIGNTRHEKSPSDNVSTIEIERNGLSCSHHETSSKKLASPLKRGSQAARVNGSSRRKKRRRPLSKVLASTEIVVPQFYSKRETQNDLHVLDSSESKKTDISVVINNSSDCSDNSCEKTLDAGTNGYHPLIDNGHLPCQSIQDDPSSGFRFDAECAYSMFDIPIVVEDKYPLDVPPTSTSWLSNGTGLTALEKQHVYGNEAVQGVQKKQMSTAHDKDERRNKESSPASHLETSRCSLESGADMDESATGAVNGSELYLQNDLHGNGLSTSFNGNSHRVFCSKSFTASDLSSQLVGHGLVSSDLYENDLLDRGSGACDSHNIDSSFRSKLRVTSSCKHTDVPINRRTSLHKRTKQSSIQKFESGTDLHCKMPKKGLKSVNMQIRSCSMSNLYDVNIDVQTSHRGPHAPLVSLMSKLNGKAIVGHPIAVDSVDSGSMAALLTNGYYMENTVSRLGISKQEKKISCTKQANACLLPSKVNVKFSKTRKSRLMSKKMRKLSTISVGNGKIVEKPRGSVVSCVPLKLVFSRINEALGRRL